MRHTNEPTAGKRRVARSIHSVEIVTRTVGLSTADGTGAAPAAAATTTTTTTTTTVATSAAARRSKLQLQCSDGSLFDVTHEEAMMSSTLWMLLQDVSERRKKVTVRHHTIPIFDVPSASVELALYFCRCLYKQQVEGREDAMADWEAVFYNLDSKMLCDLAKVASNLDIQPLVDITCRSIAQIMSATEAAHEIRQKFGLDDGPELRNGMAGFDFDMFNSLDHDLSTDEYELVEFDQPSVDELVNFINGDSGKSNANGGSRSSGKKPPSSVDGGASETNGSSKKKKKKKKSKKKTTNSNSPLQTSDQDGNEDDDCDADGDEADAGSSSKNSSAISSAPLSAQELQQKMMLAQQNLSAVFPESEFEDEEDEELDEQLESFRLALESAHLETKPKLKPCVDFTPQDVFRNRSIEGYRPSARLSTATIS